jgi:colicin import membrane protein
MYPHEQDESKSKYFIIAICFHIALVLSFFIFKGFSSDAEATPTEEVPESSTQDSAEMADSNLQSIEDLQKQAEIDKLKKESMVANSIPARDVDEAIADHKNRLDSEQKAIEEARQEKLRKIEEAKEQKRQQEIAIKKKAEDDKKAAEEAKQEKVRQDKEKADEKKRLEKEKADKAEKLKDEQERLEKAQKIEEAKKLEEERKRKSAEAIKKAEDDKREQQLKQALMKKKAAEAGRSSANNKGYNSDKPSLSNNERMAFLRAYRDDVYNSVYSNWIRPSYSKRGWECKVHVTQTNTGKVINVKIISCQGDTDFQDSVKKAIFKSSPLPLPKHPSLFNDTVEIKFKVT